MGETLREPNTVPGYGIKQTSCACATIRRTARALTQLYDLVLSPVGMNITQFTILSAIAENGEIAQWKLSQQYAFSPETLSRRLSALRMTRWVQMRAGSARRERLYSLTQLGKQKLEEAIPYWNRAQQRLRLASGEHGWRHLTDFADNITVAAKAARAVRTQNPPQTDEVTRARRRGCLSPGYL